MKLEAEVFQQELRMIIFPNSHALEVAIPLPVAKKLQEE